MSWSEIKKKREQETSTPLSKAVNNVTGGLWKQVGQNIIKSQQERQLRQQQEEEKKKQQEELRKRLNLSQNIQAPSQTQNTYTRQDSTWNKINNVANNNIRIANPEETKNAQLMTTADIKAKEQAEEFNKTMKEGTKVDKFNAIVGHLGDAVIGGTKQTVGGLANLGTVLGADAVKFARMINDNEDLERLQNRIVEKGRDFNDRATYFNKVNSRLDNNVVKTLGGAVNTVSNVGTNALLTMGTGGGTLLQGLQVAGSSGQEVLNENENATGNAVLTGVLKGGTSYLTEKMFDANILTKGTKKSSIQNAVNKIIEKKISSPAGRLVADKLVGVAGENIEELVEDNVGNVIDKVINNKDLPSWKEWFNDTSETVKATTLSTIMLDLIGFGGSNYDDMEADLRKQNVSEKDIKKAKEFVKTVTNENLNNQNVNQPQMQNQTPVNNLVDQQQKVSQNGLSQEQNSLLKKVDAIKDNISEDDYNQLRDMVNNNEYESAEYFNDFVKQVNQMSIEQNYKSSDYRTDQNRKRAYSQYQRENNLNGIKYNNDIVNNALDTVKANRNGRRTVGQWKQVASQIGLEASDLSKADIDNIAYGSWFDLQPSKNITKYDNRTKERKGFERLTSDEWVNAIYESARNQKIQNLDTTLEQYSLSEETPQNNFKYEKSDNAKVDTFRQDASRYWDNSEKTSKLVNTIEKIINDKGYNIRLDDTIGDNVNGRIVTNPETGETEITINPNSNRKGEFIIGHELTHAIETKEMVDLVKSRMQKDGELRNAVEDLKRLYGTDDINAEVLADISGQLFGNQEFINNLSTEKPSVFKRIYDTIVSLANKITGNSNEALFIKDLKNKWEKAYRENNNNIREEQYSKNATNLPEVKEGYTRLYRGLESEYNPQYDKNKLDNVNGYESWTDDYDLAKSYGDNVYYIDIPTSEIKNSIIDEDSTSETYGDRNLIYKNDKPVGINGKSGNEYMLYTEHDNYKNIKYNKTNNQATAQDNQGKVFKQDIANKFKELTGDSIRLAEAKLAGVEVRNNMRQNSNLEGEFETNPYSKEAMDLYNKYQSSKKTSSYLYHATGIDRLDSIIKNGLTTGNKQNQEGVSSKNKLYLSATEGLAQSFAPQDNITFRINPKMYNQLENLENDLLGGEGSYSITNNIPPEMIQIKENNKWVNLLDSKQAKQNQQKNISTDNQGRQLSKQQQEYFKDSKVRDENGNLLTLYHGTNSEFNIFDLTKGGQSNTGASIGFWFTETKQGAENFANDVWYGDKKPNVKENYLDLKNPKVYENVQNEELKEQYRKQSDELENKAKEIRKEYSWDKTDYKTTMTFDTLIRDYQQANYQKKNVDLDSFERLAKERGFNEEQISNMERDAKKYVELLQESKNATNEYYKLRYGDAYEQFKIDLYETGGQTAEEANTGGLGMALNNPKETVEKFRNKLIKEGYDGIIIKNTQYDNSNFNGENNQYVAFYPNQIKNVDNKTPTDNPDIRYSKQNQSWQDYLEKNYKSEGTTTDLRDIRLPMKQKQEVKLPMKENIQQTQENAQNNNTPGETINWNEIQRPENNQKFRKHYKSIIESSNTTAEAKAIARELMGKDTYTPETNKGQLAQADQRIMTSSPESELQSLLSRVMNNEKITPVDIAVGERLIQYFSKTGDAINLQNSIQATAMAGTSAGQTVQALAMLNHQTPQGQATWIQRSVDKMNKELARRKGGTITTDVDGNLQVINKQGKDITNKVDLFNLTPEMINKIMNSENQEQMYKNIDEAYEELGQQVPKGMLEKIDSWRYFSMLANARTHIRNMVGNVAMGKMQRVKDKLAGGIEDIVSKFNPGMERTKTLRRADAKTKNFAKQDFNNMEVQSRLELNENKYNPQSRLQNARKTFKNQALENTLGRLFNLNDKLLSAEDGIGLKSAYQKALADYITANKIDVDNITDAQLGKARNYAVQQAKEATFHQANAIASAVAQFENKNLATKLFTGAVLPFKKTPMNVAKAGMEYSPLQIAKSATLDLVNLRKGNISINQYIDNLSKGMTGTGVALVGYALANAGILKASGGDDKDKEKYDEEQGKQSYSIEIAGKTYSLDWLAPTGIPLFIGAETYKLFNQDDTEKSSEKSSEENRLNQAIKGASNLLNAGATAINPMSEMSMISGLTSALSSYNTSDNLGSLGNIMTNAGKSYINQFFPTLMGQVAKTGDEYERTTKSTATGTIGKAVDQTINQIKAKVPGLRQTLPIKTDIWGKDIKQEPNLPLRALNNFINPATVKEVSTDKVDKELNKLYEENKNSALLPDILTKTVQLNGQTYRLSNKEYAEFTKNYGQTSHKLIEDFIKTSDYSRLTQEQKETAISDIYSYAKEQNKLNYAEKVDEDVKPTTLYTTMEAISKNGGKQSEYLNYLAKTKGMSKEVEKNEVLANSNYSNKTKEIIYTNGTGKDDNLYNNLLSKSSINMTEYLNYKNKVSNKEFSADKDSNGKTISGSAKTKVINYLNNNITGAGNRLLIAGNSYALTNSEKQKLAQYINQIATTKEARLEIYEQLDKNFTVKDGKVYMKVSSK